MKEDEDDEKQMKNRKIKGKMMRKNVKKIMMMMI